MKYPLVSCMMLTYNRFAPFKKAIECFVNQTYPNTELVIVNSGDRKYYNRVNNFLDKHGLFKYHKIKHIHYDKSSIGVLRNVAIDNSSGEYIIVFDDDDIHHEDRISKQIDLCISSNIHATILRNFVACKKGIFKSQYHKCSILKGLEGTLLFKRGLIRYPDMNQGEDTSFISLLKYAKYNIAIIDEPYELYQYNFYGKNTISKDHFENMIQLNKPLR